MAFPISPDDGDVYGSHRWNATVGAWIKFPIATQGEAETGTVDNVQMTPERTTQTVNEHSEVDTNSAHTAGDGSDHGDVAENTADIADIRTTTGTSDEDVNMGAYTGTVLTDDTTAKANIQELGTAVDLNTGASHAESHDIASHSDTTATGPELDDLTDGSDADSLHAHATNDSHVAGDGSDHGDVATNTSDIGTNVTAIGLNTTHRGSNGTNHSNVVSNNDHRLGNGSDHSEVSSNTTHRGSNGTNHANVVLNDTHRGSDGKDHSDVVLNNGLRAWVSTRTYVEGEATFHEGSLYFSLQDANEDKEPGVETTYWVAFVGGGGGGGLDIGVIFAHGGTVAPIGSEACDGGALSRTEFNELFAEIGTTWGVGDGSTTFNKPDLRGAGFRGTGSHGSETMANGNPYAGPAVGDFEDDQMQGHRHSLIRRSGTSSYFDADESSHASGYEGVNDSAVLDPSTDTVHGTPRVGDETRMFAAGVLICIKATPATASGEPLPTYSYSTGWVANSDWTNTELVATHGLDAPIEDLIVKFFIAESSDGSDAIEVVDTALDVSSAANRSRGLQFEAVSNAAILVRTAGQGIQYFTSAGTSPPSLLSTQSWYYNIVVYRPEVLASEIETTKYDTGWVANSDWTNVELSATHNLGTELSGLIVKFFISWDGTDSGSFEPLLIHKEAAASGIACGITLYQTSNNSLKFQLGLNGIMYIADSTAAQYLLDSESWYYRIVVYKPEMIASVTTAEFRTIISDYTITDDDANIFSLTAGAVDRTITLPLLSNGTPGDEKELVKADSGIGKATLEPHATDTNSIDGVDAIDIDSQYNRVRVRHMGTWWKVIAYEDHGSNANGEWRREADGSQTCCAGHKTNNASGSRTWTFPAAFVDITKIAVGGSYDHTIGGAVFITFGHPTTTNVDYGAVVSPTGAWLAASTSVALWATGRWRT